MDTKSEYRLFRIGSEAIWVFGGQVGVALGGLLSVKVLTHLLNPHEYGRFSIANTVILLISANFFGPLGQGLMRYWAIVQDRRALKEYVFVSDKYIRRLICFSVLLACLSGLILLILHKQQWISIIVLSLLSGAFSGWASVRLSILMAARKRKQVSAINVLTAFAKPAAAGILVICLVHQTDIAVLGFLLVAFFSAFMAELFFRRTSEKRLTNLNQANNLTDDNLGRSVLQFSKPFFIWSIFAWMHLSCDRWALLAFQGADAVGAYSVIAQLAYYPLVFGSGFLNSFFIPIAYQRAGGLESDKDTNSGNRVLFGMVILYVIGAALIITLFYLFHRQLVLFISNEKYAAYSFLLPMLTVAWSFYYFGQVLSGFGFLANKPNLYIMPIVSSSILATVTSFYLAFKFGIVGIIWALGIAGCIYAAWCLIIAKRLMASCKGT